MLNNLRIPNITLKRESITFRYLAYASILLLVVQVLFGAFQITVNYRERRAELDNKVNQQSIFLSTVSPEALLRLDFVGLETLMRQTSDDPDIVYSVVVDAQGNPMTRYLNIEDPLIAEVRNVEGASSDIRELVADVAQNPSVEEIRTPIVSEQQLLGEVVLGYSLDRITSQTGTAAVTTLFTSILVTALLFVVTIVIFSRIIQQPLAALTNAASELASGNLDERAEVRREDEIGQLGDTFNQMAEQLQKTIKAHETAAKEARLASAMAREANRLKSEFLATMSHELRTPLNAIIGFTEILLAGMTGELSDRQEHKVTRIHQNSKRLLGLINDLLDLAKIEAGRIEIQREPFAPRELAMTVSQSVESLADKKGLDFQYEVDPELPSLILGDPVRIEQALKNLLGNAFKFTDAGGVVLRFDGVNKDQWELSVKDTGIGIPAHAVEFIFDEFRQVDGTSQRAYGGTGLGLAITRNLARVMGGDIRVSSTLGEGSTFIITLPMEVPSWVEAETV